MEIIIRLCALQFNITIILKNGNVNYFTNDLSPLAKDKNKFILLLHCLIHTIRLHYYCHNILLDELNCLEHYSESQCLS